VASSLDDVAALSDALAFVLILAAAAKCLKPAGTMAFITDTGLSERSAARALGAVVAVEAGLGIALLSGLSPLLFGLAAVVVGTLFLVVQGHAIRYRGRPCSCFGPMEEKSHYAGLVRAVALVIMSVSIMAASGAETVARAPQLPRPSDLIAGVILAVTLLLTTALIDQTAWFWSARNRLVAAR
jgi:hypothetical protein